MDDVVKERETSLNHYRVYPVKGLVEGMTFIVVKGDFWEVDEHNNLTVFIGEPKDARRVAYFPTGFWWSIYQWT